MNKNHIGEIYFHHKYGKYTVINRKKFENNTHYLYQIEFENTGTKLWERYDHIKNNSVKDPYAKTVYGVACLGEPGFYYEKEYDLWNSILRRCYCKKCTEYSRYGAKGVFVSERWLNFANFIKDLRQMENYDKLIAGEPYVIDKDILQSEVVSKVYSFETCKLILASANSCEMINRRKNNNEFSSRYFGVSCRNNMFRSFIYNPNSISLGSYSNEVAAATVYDFYAKQLGKTLINNTNMSLYQALCYKNKYFKNNKQLELPIGVDPFGKFENKVMCTLADNNPNGKVMCVTINK